MTLLGPPAEAVPDRIGALTAWLPRIAVALAFGFIGLSKFRDPMWIRVFARIGIGQWFRYLTGAMQIGGALLALVPRLALAGIAAIACTMFGAVVFWIAFGPGETAIVPGTLLAILIAIGWTEYNRTRA